MPLTEEVIAFEVPGPICSSNNASRIVNGRAVKSAEKRHDEERIRSIAIAASVRFRWKIPEYVAVEILAINTRLDADNLCKAINDSLQGIVVSNDGRIRDLRVRKIDEKGLPERYLVTVRKMER